MTTSGVVDKSLRRHVCPVLRDHGFGKIGPRKSWAWRDSCVLIFEIRAVGRYFADVTGWPPGSVCGWLGAYYPFIPTHVPVKSDAHGRLLPTEVWCHMRGHLAHGLDQESKVRVLANPKERARRDIWWVVPDGSNAETVAIDIACVLKAEGLPRYSSWSDLPTALTEIEREHDCYQKYLRAYHVARQIGDEARAARYRDLLINEAKRIGQVPAL
jgi:hypothetical protein